MKKILIIDDNEIVRKNLSELLELSNFKIVSADNGKEGVRLAASEKPDLILCDIMMPGVDGYEVLYLLSTNDDTANIPFIFLTAKSEKVDIRKGMLMGADDYLIKPCDETELLEAIDRRLKKAESFERKFSRDIHGFNQFLNSAKGLTELQELAIDKKPHRLRKGHILYTEGDDADRVYFLSKGTVKTFKQNEQGKELITGIYKSGDFIGAMDMLKYDGYNESAMLIEEAEVVAIQQDELLSLIYSHRDVAMRFIQMLSNDVNELKTVLLDAVYSSVRKRIANALLLLQKKNNGNSAIELSRENLAGMTGVTTETISRTLTDFKEEGLIELKTKQIAILNPQKLAAIKN